MASPITTALQLKLIKLIVADLNLLTDAAFLLIDASSLEACATDISNGWSTQEPPACMGALLEIIIEETFNS